MKVLIKAALVVFLCSGTAYAAEFRASDDLNVVKDPYTPAPDRYTTNPTTIDVTKTFKKGKKRYPSGPGYDSNIDRQIKYYEKNWDDPKVRRQARELQRDLQRQINEMLDNLEEGQRELGY